jgi:hypothetical protein
MTGYGKELQGLAIRFKKGGNIHEENQRQQNGEAG